MVSRNARRGSFALWLKDPGGSVILFCVSSFSPRTAPGLFSPHLRKKKSYSKFLRPLLRGAIRHPQSFEAPWRSATDSLIDTERWYCSPTPNQGLGRRSERSKKISLYFRYIRVARAVCSVSAMRLCLTVFTVRFAETTFRSIRGFNLVAHHEKKYWSSCWAEGHVLTWSPSQSTSNGEVNQPDKTLEAF